MIALQVRQKSGVGVALNLNRLIDAMVGQITNALTKSRLRMLM